MEQSPPPPNVRTAFPDTRLSFSELLHLEIQDLHLKNDFTLPLNVTSTSVPSWDGVCACAFLLEAAPFVGWGQDAGRQPAS